MQFDFKLKEICEIDERNEERFTIAVPLRLKLALKNLPVKARNKKIREFFDLLAKSNKPE
jgi:hypothetical protein